MKIIIEFDEKAGRFNMQYEGSHVAALGLLAIAESAIIKKGAQEGSLKMPIRRVGS